MHSLLKALPRLICPKGDPLQLIFFVTSKCNLRCSHCFYIDNINKEKDELSLKEIEKTSKGMGELLWLALTGGEPFLRKDLPAIAETFYLNNKFNILTLTTNGLMTEPIVNSVSLISKKCKSANIIVYVSIDGMRETHNKIRQSQQSFDKALETIKALKKLKRDFRNLNIATVTTLTSQNQMEAKELAYYIKDKIRPDNMTINLLRGGPSSGPLGEIDLKYYDDFVAVEKAGLKNGEIGYFKFAGSGLARKKEVLQKEIVKAVYKDKRCVLPCLAGKISGVLSETGEVHFCEILDKKIGNIRQADYNFKRLWYSKEAEALRRFITDTRCFCTYECAISSNILFNPRGLAKLLKLSSGGGVG
ncbi:MAG: radical SAM protein [Candidatus Omnitrophica bacterium]|nr:radical SAM protein [Candidatus Omnitrophota bacterium]